MNLLTLLLLAVLAFFFIQEGMSFIGFLLIIVIALIILSQAVSKPRAARTREERERVYAERYLGEPLGGAGASVIGGGTITSGAFARMEGAKGGIVIEEEAPAIPPNIDIKIKPNWESNTLFEDIFASDGEILDTIGRGVVRFVTGAKPRKPGEEPPEGGR